MRQASRPGTRRRSHRPTWPAPLVTAIALALATTPAAAQDGPQISTLSGEPHLISGDDALVRVEVPRRGSPLDVRVALDGRDITPAFRQDTGGVAWVGLVTGLREGENRLTASAGGAEVELTVTSYPLTGPILSGPQLQPFICQTHAFELPGGGTLGPARDAACSVDTRVDYLYLPEGAAEFVPLPDTGRLPADVATATTLAGVTVPFVVRLETGTMNRGIYQNAVLHDPTTDPTPSPFAPPRGWNRRLIAVHGSGCTGGWYVQGAAQGVDILDLERLGEGYALFINTLNHPTNSCNAFLAGETTMMGKEHFIETFGVPDFTVSTGCSGGAYTSLQVADAFPGLFDGVHIACTYPDALAIAVAGLDSRLLSRYLHGGNPAGFTVEQMVAVSGHKNARAWYDLALQSGRTDPVPGRTDPTPASELMGAYSSARWNDAVPEALRYHPVTNPRGARPTVFDVARNVYGVDRATGFALWPYDNVGVQYGLHALNTDVISKAQFLDLNERVGGYDQDANPVPSRSVGDVGAIERAYRSGVMLGGGGGLAEIPVFDISGIYDDDQYYHYQWFHFAVRERMRDQNGHADNHVMWRGGAAITDRLGRGAKDPVGAAVGRVMEEESWDVFIDWVAAYTADPSSDRALDRVRRHRPARAVDGCYTKSATPEFIAEPQTLNSEPDTRCNELWPSWTFPRHEAGGPLHANNLRCQLRPLDRGDYEVEFTPQEWARLEAVFPEGVCDWSKPGVGQRRVEPWSSFGPSPQRRVIPTSSR